VYHDVALNGNVDRYRGRSCDSVQQYSRVRRRPANCRRSDPIDKRSLRIERNRSGLRHRIANAVKPRLAHLRFVGSAREVGKTATWQRLERFALSRMVGIRIPALSGRSEDSYRPAVHGMSFLAFGLVRFILP
jgi:hypothetical protein